MPVSLRTLYDQLAETYEANRGTFDMSAVLEAFFHCLTVSPGDLLDLGCGAGEPWARAFVDRGWKVTGVDFSSRMLALAGRYVPEMSRINADMREVAFAPNSFDAITAIYSLFHVPRGEHLPLFERFHRWLRPGGRLLFTYATVDYTGADAFEGTIEFLGQPLFYSHDTQAGMHRDLAAAGLSILDETDRAIGGETFLWVTAARSIEAATVPSSHKAGANGTLPDNWP